MIDDTKKKKKEKGKHEHNDLHILCNQLDIQKRYLFISSMRSQKKLGQGYVYRWVTSTFLLTTLEKHLGMDDTIGRSFVAGIFLTFLLTGQHELPCARPIMKCILCMC